MNKGEIAFTGSPKEVFSNRKALESLHLEMPFIMDLKDRLKKENITIKSIDDLDKIAEELWPSK